MTPKFPAANKLVVLLAAAAVVALGLGLGLGVSPADAQTKRQQYDQAMARIENCQLRMGGE